MAATGIGKYKLTKSLPKIFSVAFHKYDMKNNKAVKTMFASSLHQPIAPS